MSQNNEANSTPWWGNSGLSNTIVMENSICTIGNTHIECLNGKVKISPAQGQIEITETSEPKTEPEPSTSQETPFDPLVKNNDWSHFYETGQFTDLVFAFADGSELRAHKMFLIGRSAVFQAMFQHDTKERQENKVLITDFSKEIFEAMLIHVYSGKVEKIEEQAVELLIAADRYALNDLKNQCEKWLCTQLTKDNCSDLAALAGMINAEALQTKADQFMQKNNIPMEPKKLLSIEQLALITTKDLITQVLPEEKPKATNSIVIDGNMLKSIKIGGNSSQRPVPDGALHQCIIQRGGSVQMRGLHINTHNYSSRNNP